MSLKDFEETDDSWLKDTPEESVEPINPYLEDANKAYNLVRQFLGIEKGENLKKSRMNDDIERFISEELLSGVNRLQLKNEAQLQRELSKLAERVEEVEKYKVLHNKAVVGLGGKFSSGKSKFINSILNVTLLPTEQSPTTSIPTYLVKDVRDGIQALSNEGNWIELNENEMQSLTHRFHEKYGMGFANFVNSLVITQINLTHDTLAFLDTPGYNKSDKHGGVSVKDVSDEKKAFEQLKNADYLIWLIDIENGVITEDDLNFVEKLNLDHPPLIVINKMDKRPDNEIGQILEAVKKALKDKKIKNFGVTAYSSLYNEEFNHENLICNYLDMAAKQNYSDEDVVLQVLNCCAKIEAAFKEALETNREVRRTLREAIKQAEDVLNIRSLVAEYGEIIAYIEELKKGQAIFETKFMKLKEKLSIKSSAQDKGIKKNIRK